jgi:hypothetical protein
MKQTDIAERRIIPNLIWRIVEHERQLQRLRS